MQKIKISTYFDITYTNVVRTFRPEVLPLHTQEFIIKDSKEWYYRRRQQSNWETMFQIVMMRIQPENLTKSVVTEADGKKVWSFEFENHQELAYQAPDSDDPLAILKSDFANIPMITELDETEQLDAYIDIDKNTFVELLNE
jgi:hypothetical protein